MPLNFTINKTKIKLRKEVKMGQGRPPKLSVVTKKHLTKEEKEQRKKLEKKIQTDCNLEPPTWLNDLAKTEFNRVVNAIKDTEFNLLDNLDLSILAIYAQTYSQYLNITEQLQNAETEEIHKLYRLQKMQIETIMQCSNKLGLAISDRLRLVLPKKEEKPSNPFLQFLDEK